MAKVNMMQLREVGDYTRADLVRWRDTIRAEVLAHIEAAYAESPFRWHGDLEPKWIDNALSDALSDATHETWEAMEEE